jgi:hypothetical protein
VSLVAWQRRRLAVRGLAATKVIFLTLQFTESVPVEWLLGGVPRAGVLGRYGGGDGMATARSVLLVERPASLVPEDIKRRVHEETVKVIARHAQTPQRQRVGELLQRPGAV